MMHLISSCLPDFHIDYYFIDIVAVVFSELLCSIEGKSLSITLSVMEKLLTAEDVTVTL